MGATDYKQIAIWIDKHVQKEQVKKLLGVEFNSVLQIFLKVQSFFIIKFYIIGK